MERAINKQHQFPSIFLHKRFYFVFILCSSLITKASSLEIERRENWKYYFAFILCAICCLFFCFITKCVKKQRKSERRRFGADFAIMNAEISNLSSTNVPRMNSFMSNLLSSNENMEECNQKKTLLRAWMLFDHERKQQKRENWKKWIKIERKKQENVLLFLTSASPFFLALFISVWWKLIYFCDVVRRENDIRIKKSFSIFHLLKQNFLFHHQKIINIYMCDGFAVGGGFVDIRIVWKWIIRASNLWRLRTASLRHACPEQILIIGDDVMRNWERLSV